MKGVAAASTGSAAMLAETFHSIADTGNQVLLFVGMRLSERPPNRAHGFGHGKDVYFWAFVVSLLLFSLGGAFSIWEGLHKLLDLAHRGRPRAHQGQRREDLAQVLARQSGSDDSHRSSRGHGGFGIAGGRGHGDLAEPGHGPSCVGRRGLGADRGAARRYRGGPRPRA